MRRLHRGSEILLDLILFSAVVGAVITLWSMGDPAARILAALLGILLFVLFFVIILFKNDLTAGRRKRRPVEPSKDQELP